MEESDKSNKQPLYIIINRLLLHLYNIACDRSFDHVKAMVTSHETDYGFNSQGNKVES